MAPLTINLEPYKALIFDMHQKSFPTSSICATLLQDHGIQVSPRTISYRISEWGFPAHKITFEFTPKIKALISFFFCDVGTPDHLLLHNLREIGYPIPNKRLLQEARRAMGLRQRMLGSNVEKEKALLKSILQKHTVHLGPQGQTRSYGSRFLYTYINALGTGRRFSRNNIAAVMRNVDPDSVRRRYEEMKKARGEFRAHGPNFVWSIDGYCKLRFAGIEIYAGIDAYSRYVPWVYVGICSGCAVNILCQYIDLAGALKIIPLHIRSDRGSETPMVADAHYILHKATFEGLGAESYDFADCYWFGTSTANQRIESWWGQLAKGMLNKWKIWFKHLRTSAPPQYSRKSLPDCIAMLAVYLPIIRTQVQAFVKLWNIHMIRKQANRPHVVPGQPFQNYWFPPKGVRDYGLPVNEEKLAEIKQGYQEWDMNAYLPADTLSWCHEALETCGFQLPITEYARDAKQEILHKNAYLVLRAEITHHLKTTSNTAPRLGLLENPTGAYDWVPHPDVAVGLEEARLKDYNDQDGVHFTNEGRDTGLRDGDLDWGLSDDEDGNEEMEELGFMVEDVHFQKDPNGIWFLDGIAVDAREYMPEGHASEVEPDSDTDLGLPPENIRRYDRRRRR